MRKVTFKSSGRFFDVEKSGLKNNTIRIQDDEKDERFHYLEDIRENMRIEIINPETGESFERKIKHIAIWKTQGLKIFIISWVDNSELQKARNKGFVDADILNATIREDVKKCGAKAERLKLIEKLETHINTCPSDIEACEGAWNESHKFQTCLRYILEELKKEGSG